MSDAIAAGPALDDPYAAANTPNSIRTRIEANAPDLLAYFSRRVDLVDAADLLGDTLLVAWRKNQSIPRDGTAARMWLFGIARRVLKQHHRAQHRRTALSARLREAMAAAPAHGGLNGSPADEAHLTERLRAHIEALGGLDREIVRLIYWDGFTGDEVALIMSLRPGTVRSRLSRARAALRQALESEDSVPD